ncbi:hypothetical protein BG261_04800 [Floricoccus tropicus]|uniref:SGNH hydrolase-type esterase domain-containing protein n=1 Tax=Floricoccus tropicus TaxID=1859473 RepID=A0A1E8GL58_9LACT|nr:GDSL-type esterase/lipase family protein [Floricoccus tropicus]OFI48985.1 hypothetical protein BG261_04800 [Floricoccus tropicus]
MKIQLTGDSLMARNEGLKEPAINETLKNRINGLEIVNTAVCGENSGALLERIDSEILAVEKAQKIFIIIGTNDLATNKRVFADQYEENLQAIILRLIGKYDRNNIFFLSIPPIDEDKQRFRSNLLINEYNTVLKEVCLKNNCNYLLFNERLNRFETKELQDILEGSMDDGLHFGLKGYQIMADIIYEAL